MRRVPNWPWVTRYSSTLKPGEITTECNMCAHKNGYSLSSITQDFQLIL